MFQIGEIVRVIPDNYVGLFKTFNYVDNWQEPNISTDECVMLGARYKVLNVETESNGNIFYSLLKNGVNGRGWVLEKYLLPDREIVECPFNVGDSVVLSLSDEDIKKQYFPVWNEAYSFNDKSSVYRVTEILNNFFIFIKFEKDNSYSAPFRWDNFELAKLDKK